MQVAVQETEQSDQLKIFLGRHLTHHFTWPTHTGSYMSVHVGALIRKDTARVGEAS